MIVMRYRISCPYCHHTLSIGKGSPFKHIGDPLRRCPMCKKFYVDSNVYEWGALNPIYKFWYYLGANNRGIFFLFFILFTWACYVGERYTAAVVLSICSVLWLPFCYIYVNIAHKYDIQESIERCKHEGYIQKLRDINYDKLYVTAKTVTPTPTLNEVTTQKIAVFICEKCGQKLTALNTKCTACGSTSIHRHCEEVDRFPSISSKFAGEIIETTYPKTENSKEDI